MYVLTLAVLQPMQLMSLYSVLTLTVLQPMQLMSQYCVCVNPCAAAHAVDVIVLCISVCVNLCCAAALALDVTVLCMC